LLAGIEPIEHSGSDTPDMEKPSWARRKSDSDLAHAVLAGGGVKVGIYSTH